ncbi:MAG: hypothetical protein HRT45_19145 [Bdellovibrionales bacterium]|nr:hypothetical protein [Bdellovibrionales bacterium]
MNWQLLILICTSLALSTGCVSVNLAKNEVKKAEGLSFKNPGGKFSEFDSELVDKGWRHTGNGNAISFVSDCENQFDPPLKNIEAGVVGAIDQKTSLFSKSETYNDRASLHSLYSGQVDGIPTKVELVTFKKNGCIYVISYVAVENAYDSNQEDFTKFLREFKAP